MEKNLVRIANIVKETVMQPLMKVLVSLDNYQPYSNFGKGIEIVREERETIYGLYVFHAPCPRCGMDNPQDYWPGSPIDRDGCKYHIICKKCDNRYDAVQEGRE
jgi:hypothetical protein